MAPLNPEAARIFRITHIENLGWILRHGLHCKNANVIDPNFVPIGMADLIRKRSTHDVPIPPGGTLGDYIPFYFTPWSVMMYNIRTGYNDVIRRDNADIAILVSSLHKLKEVGTRFVFTNGHAYLRETDFFEDLAELDQIDWELLRQRDFKRDPEDPGKVSRYQAEALAHRHVPVKALLGIGCYNSAARAVIDADIVRHGHSLKVKVLPDWYF